MDKALQPLYQRAIRLLASREHSRLQLFRKLTDKGFDSEQVDSVLALLAQQNLQSDERFTEDFIHSRINRGQGPIRIQAELRERGASDELINEYLDFSDVTWSEQVDEVRRKRFGHALPEDYQTRAKQARFLQYRGFTSEQIRRALGQSDFD